MVGDELTRNWSRRHKAPARFGGRSAISNVGLAFGVWRRAHERIDESAFIAEDCRVVAPASWSPPFRPFLARSFCLPRGTGAFAKAINLHAPGSRRIALR